jgi:hypothetical protein
MNHNSLLPLLTSQQATKTKITVEATLKVIVILTLSDGVPKSFEYQSIANTNNNNNKINVKSLVNELFDKIIKKVSNNLLPNEKFVINPNVIGTILFNVIKNNISEPSFTIPLPNLPFNSIPSLTRQNVKVTGVKQSGLVTPAADATKSSLRKSQELANKNLPININ